MNETAATTGIDLASVLAELIWHNVRDSRLTEEELLRYLEAYHLARRAQEEAETRKDATAQILDRWLTDPKWVHPVIPEPEPPGPDAITEYDQEAAKGKPGNTSAHGAKSLATRKKNVLDAIDRHRAAGVSLQGVADAGRGLTLTDVMDAVEHKVLPLPKWAALEKAVAALDKRAEEGRTDSPEK